MILCGLAITAGERFEQIEEGGVEHEFVQLITNADKAQDIFYQLVKSVKKEVLLFLANDKALVRIDRLGLIDHIIKISQEANATIKIVSPLSQKNLEIVNRIYRSAPSITILNSDTYSLFSLCIIDGQKLLRAEIKQFAADSFSGAVNFALYSNRKLTVDSFKSIFELLWNERILNEQLQVHDKMQSEFINIAAHELRTPIQSILGYSELLK